MFQKFNVKTILLLGALGIIDAYWQGDEDNEAISTRPLGSFYWSNLFLSNPCLVRYRIIHNHDNLNDSGRELEMFRWARNTLAHLHSLEAVLVRTLNQKCHCLETWKY